MAGVHRPPRPAHAASRLGSHSPYRRRIDVLLIVCVLTYAAAGLGLTRSAPEPAVHAEVAAGSPCVGGASGEYKCSNVDLLSRLSLSAMGGAAKANDIWGWTDPVTGKEYALVGLSNGTAFVDISTPTSPVYVGRLPTATSDSTWRAIRVHADHAFVISEATSHGMQVFDLTRLRDVTNPPVTFTADARVTQFGDAHTIGVNEQTGYIYVNGSNTCSGGLRIYDVRAPKEPAFAGCVGQDGYVHDSQCVVWRGPDTRYTGREICFNSNADTVTIVDVTNKSSPVQLARKSYSSYGYVHQGWLTEDHWYFLQDDELDEVKRGHNSRTYVWNVADLRNPSMIGYYSGPTKATDHNLFVKGRYVFESNDSAGLRILDLGNIAQPAKLIEVGYFDVYPSSNAAGNYGSWSNYPYFSSGVVVVSSRDRGLFVLKPNLSGEPPPPPPPPPTVVYSDTFESAAGWAVNPQGSDSATNGRFERGNPESTRRNGAKQLGTTKSGSNDLVTGRLAGGSAGAYDVDGGTTSVWSPEIQLPSSEKITLALYWYLARAKNATSADFIRVKVVSGAGTQTVFEKLGSATDRDAAWALGSYDLTALAGQTVRILVEAADGGSASLVEAAIDDVKITAQ